MLSSDPSAWLREYYAKLSENPSYRLFAPSHQFEQLVAAVARDHPAKAASMLEWSAAAQVATVSHLASMVEQKASRHSVELWRVRKGERELRCAAYYIAIGIDLRLMQGEDFRRTQLCTDAPAAHELANKWLIALKARGWTTPSRQLEAR